MTTLYFIRHGETDFNRLNIVQGRRINAALNAFGRVQAQLLGEKLSSAGLDALYSSPLLRATQTADAIAAHYPGIARIADPDLEEMSWGILEGAANSTYARKAFRQFYVHWGRHEYDFAMEGGESVLDVAERALNAYTRILAHHAGKTVAVVTHGRWLRVLLASILPEYGLARMNDIQHHNTAVNRIEVAPDGQVSALYLNDISHLDSLSN
jgi:broad specificity phosphatase PhoE